MNERGQTHEPSIQERLGATHRDNRPRQLPGWFTVKELAERLRFTVTAPSDPEKACRDWLKAKRIVGVKRGRVILIDGLDVDRALRGR